MNVRTLALAVTLFAPISGFAQHAAASTTVAAASANTSQFDFLLGRWEIELHPKTSGLVALIHGTPRLVGTWKAWHTPDGVTIEDELSVVDDSGNPVSATRTTRAYVAGEAYWRINAQDLTHERTSDAIGRWQNGEMHVDGRSTDANGKSLTRTRFYGITANAFHVQQDRSTDNGQTWDIGALTIDARRVAATAAP